MIGLAPWQLFIFTGYQLEQSEPESQTKTNTYTSLAIAAMMIFASAINNNSKLQYEDSNSSRAVLN